VPVKSISYDPETGDKKEIYIGGWRRLGDFLTEENDYTILSKALTEAIKNGNPEDKKENAESVPGEAKK